MANQLMQDGLQQLNLPVLILDLEGQFINLNLAAAHLFARSADELIGRSFTSVLDPGSHDKSRRMFQRIREDQRVDRWEFDHVRPGGPPFLIEYSATLLRDDAGEPVAVIAIGRDLTDQLDLTRQLAEVNQRLEGALSKLEKAHIELKETQVQLVQSEKMRSLGQLAAGVAHEINNPAAYVANNLAHLNSLIPALQDLHAANVALDASVDDQTRRRLQQANLMLGGEDFWQDLPELIEESIEGIERIRNIVKSLRNFSNPDVVGLVYANVNDGLRSTVRMAKALWETQVEILESYEDLPNVPCRPNELNQVFLNLLTNAMQAIGPDGTIWVSSRLKNDTIEVEIRDNGGGMVADTLARLGEPFFTTRPVGSGTGLGLAVSLAIIKRHKGKLTFDSQIDAGTTATIEIPLQIVSKPEI